MGRKRLLSDLEVEASYHFYLVELTWNDGTRTVFVIQSPNSQHAIQAVEVKALSMWEGYITSSKTEVITIPAAPNLPEHVYTDLSDYHKPVEPVQAP